MSTNRLIVALDTEDSLHHIVALRQAGVTFFKLNATTLMAPSSFDISHLSTLADVFLDLKVYDTSDTVYNIARRAFDLDVRFLTVHATQSMLEAAMRAKPAGDYAKVLAVGTLTDGNGAPGMTTGCDYDGIISSVGLISQHRKNYDGLLVCPGIRPDNSQSNNHKNPSTPAEAIRAGADYVVVGRPIYNAPDPVAAARAIITEIEEASR